MNCHGDPATSLALWGRDDGRDITGFKMDNKKVGDLHGAFEVIRSLSEANTVLRQTLIKSYMLATVMVILALLLISWLVKHLVGKPINNAITGIANAQKNSDLTYRMGNAKGEFAVLAESFNLFIQRIQEVALEVAQSSQLLSMQAQETAKVTDNTSKAIATQLKETALVTEATHKMSMTVEDVARNAEDTSKATQQAGEVALQGQQVVIDTIDVINNLASEVQEASNTIHRVGEDSKSINKIVGVINGIADQTNLLALNAAIEAARAGDQGRGFAVVADEVRSLAISTQESTEEIKSMVNKLQSGAQNAASVMQRGKQTADQSVQRATTAGQALENITSAVARIADLSLQITSSSQQQKAVATEVNRSINYINEVSQLTNTEAGETNRVSEGLSRMAIQLREVVSQFKVIEDGKDPVNDSELF